MDHSGENVGRRGRRTYSSSTPIFQPILEDLWAILVAGCSSIARHIRTGIILLVGQFQRLKLSLDNFLCENPNTSFLFGWSLLLLLLRATLDPKGNLPLLVLAGLLFFGCYFIYKPLNCCFSDSEHPDETLPVRQHPSFSAQDSFVPRSRCVVYIDNPPRYDSLPNLHPELFKTLPPPRYDGLTGDCGEEQPPRYSVLFSANETVLCAVHQSRSPEGSAEPDLLRTRSLGDLPGASRGLRLT